MPYLYQHTAMNKGFAAKLFKIDCGYVTEELYFHRSHGLSRFENKTLNITCYMVIQTKCLGF